LREGILMPGVHWSHKARTRLEKMNSAVRDQLTSNAGTVLHDMPPVRFPYDEGRAGAIMWHRGITCGATPWELLPYEDDDGPWNYFLFYMSWHPDPTDPESGSGTYFEVLDVCHIAEVAERWEKMIGEAF